ncbi:hypothetical protein ACWC09_39445 [Streptomyces sp. NPDC001617]
MGIRMLHRRTASPQASTDRTPRTPYPPVPVFAADASTARIPTGLATVLRRTAHRTAGDLRRRLAAATAEPATWRLWADLGCTYAAGLADRVRRAAGLLARVRRGRPAVTMFVVTDGGIVSDRPDGPVPR